MKLLILMFCFSCLIAQGKLKRVSEKIKEKVETKHKKEQEEAKETKKDNSENSNTKRNNPYNNPTYVDYYTLLHPYDNIPANAYIYIYDGRYAKYPFNPNREIESDKTPKQFYNKYPYYEDLPFTSEFTGTNSFFYLKFNESYNPSDSIRNSDFNLLVAYQFMSVSVQYLKIYGSYIANSFAFFRVAPGLYLGFDNNLIINPYFGSAAFTNYEDESKYQTFIGTDMGLNITKFLGNNFSLDLGVEYILVKEKISDRESFIKFFFAHGNLAYHINRYAFTAGIKSQTFINFSTDNEDTNFLQYALGIDLYF
jgi:hypothetical protein